MKKYIFTLLLPLALVSCEDFLNLDSKTEITGEYLKTVDGVQREAAALYDLDRKTVADNNADLYLAEMVDCQTDIVSFRGGSLVPMYRMEGLLPTTGFYNSYWVHQYKIIGKANEVITNSEALGLNNIEVKRAWAEAKFFRGRAYFNLWKRFERLYLNLEPTTVDNLNREFKASEGEEVLSVIRKDLDDAIEALDWKVPAGMTSDQYGRVTKGVAKHVRAQVAMWDKDWDTVIEHGEDIFAHTEVHKMEGKLEDVFLKDENLRSSEVLWAYQFSKNLGGGGHGNPLEGHRLSLITTGQYRKISGCICEAAQGGYGWGRIYPNKYLLDLYDKEKDTRYSQMFKHDYYYSDPLYEKYGEKINPADHKSNYMNSLHPMSKKFFDQWTNADQPDRMSSFRDVIIYRMGETALMLCEAYFNKEGAASSKALEYYNKTWQRAGNEPETSLTMDKIIDEYARECSFEGVRWPLLKRLGILGERVKLHAGETVEEDPYLDKDYAEARKNFVIGKHEVWPIPQIQIDLMGGEKVFPQNKGWY
ncbi:RagB/SusD family nutrient uptake outer membrane protein [Bacteroides sp.]|uniref:RagB/SusD family nutrient uptake outer membrane protein n=1 Tax=Bacteroides sp. TaxID=29523 RepID=UPI002582B42D|nr:RagB/SusD family nutrient uptake outer membrane protein [Bacteroides sp.]